MYEEFKAKRVIYKGIVFHSKLEARWAVIFDTFGIDWIYEPETLIRKWGDEEIYYRPDFYLPKNKVYVEVKPNDELLRKKESDIGLLVDWEGPLANGIVIVGPIPDSARMNYRIPCFSFLKNQKACVLDYVAFTPNGIMTVYKHADFCEGTDGIPKETSVESKCIACGDKSLLALTINAFTAGWFPKGIEELTE